MMKRAICMTPWDSQGNQVWDAVNDTVFTTLRGCGGAGYQQSYILASRDDAKTGNTAVMIIDHSRRHSYQQLDIPTMEAHMGTGGGNEEGKTMNYFIRQSNSEYIWVCTSSTLQCRDYKFFTDLIQEEQMEGKERKYVLRRLTPIECLRLQGLPDWWVDGANGSDSAIYKMAGNGLAIPCACDVLGRIAEEMRREE